MSSQAAAKQLLDKCASRPVYNGYVVTDGDGRLLGMFIPSINRCFTVDSRPLEPGTPRQLLPVTVQHRSGADLNGKQASVSVSGGGRLMVTTQIQGSSDFSTSSFGAGHVVPGEAAGTWKVIV